MSNLTNDKQICCVTQQSILVIKLSQLKVNLNELKQKDPSHTRVLAISVDILSKLDDNKKPKHCRFTQVVDTFYKVFSLKDVKKLSSK